MDKQPPTPVFEGADAGDRRPKRPSVGFVDDEMMRVRK